MFEDFKSNLGECVYATIAFMSMFLFFGAAVGAIIGLMALLFIYPFYTVPAILLVVNPVTCALWKTWRRNRLALVDVLYEPLEAVDDWLRRKLL